MQNTKKELMSFLGFANYHRDHVSDFAEMTASLYDLAHATDMPIWEATHTEAFERTKLALISAPCLAYPTPDGHFILDTDASDLSIGASFHRFRKRIQKLSAMLATCC